MKKYLFVAMLVFVVGALAMFAAFATDDADAFADGWTGGCGTCHNASGATPPTNVHNVAAHSTFGCTDCHTGGTNATTPDPTKCAGCHGGAQTLADLHVANVAGRIAHSPAVTRQPR